MAFDGKKGSDKRKKATGKPLTPNENVESELFKNASSDRYLCYQLSLNPYDKKFEVNQVFLNKKIPFWNRYILILLFNISFVPRLLKSLDTNILIGLKKN